MIRNMMQEEEEKKRGGEKGAGGPRHRLCLSRGASDQAENEDAFVLGSEIAQAPLQHALEPRFMVFPCFSSRVTARW